MLWELSGHWIDMVDSEGNIEEGQLDSLLLETIRLIEENIYTFFMVSNCEKGACKKFYFRTFSYIITEN
jgi:hypothetical protein